MDEGGLFPAARRLGRRMWRGLRGGGQSALALVYDPGYALPAPGAPIDHLRAEMILAFLTDEGLVRPRHIVRPLPASLKNLRRVHTDRYLESLQHPEGMEPVIGMAVDDVRAQQILEVQRLMTGGTIVATAIALRSGVPAANLGGGLHHAAADRGAGYCAINDVAITIARLRARGFTRPILVVDLDVHDGNGTRAIFADDPSVHTYSIHNTDWGPLAAAAATVLSLGAGVDDGRYLSVLRETLPPVVQQHAPGLVFYLAGVDPAADDLVGDWNITPDGMLARDRFVVEQVRRPGAEIPLVIVLAGGYGQNAWRYSARFLGWLAAGVVVEPPSNAEMLVRRAERLHHTLGGAATSAGVGPDWGLTAEDVAALSPGGGRRHRVLGRYTGQGLELLLERVSLLAHIRALGFAQPVLQLDLQQASWDTVRLFGAPDRRELLMEVRFRRDASRLAGMEVLYLEWLLLQNPRRAFLPGKRSLPGQRHPGLGLLREVSAWLLVLCQELGLDGMMYTPAGYFVATFGTRFVDPVRQARFEAMRRALIGLRLVDASRAVEAGLVMDAVSGATIAWEPAPMVVPVSDRLRALVEGPEYEAALERALEPLSYRLRPPGDADERP